MIIVKMMGGLGNQMFQYSFYRKLSTIHENVKMDIISWYSLHKAHNGYELGNIFSLFENYASIKEIEQLSCYKNLRLKIFIVTLKNLIKKLFISNIASNHSSSYSNHGVNDKNNLSTNLKLKRKLDSFIYDVSNISDANTYYNNADKSFYKDFVKNTNIYYEGFWQNVEYFEDILDIICKEFIFKNKLRGKNKTLFDIIANPNICSVSIHIRQGDYVNTAFDCLNINYYEKAVEKIELFLNNPIYFIFSDDIEYSKSNLFFLKTRKCYYIDWNKNESSYIDMQLMSKCKHNIIANSTFSWWAALLNDNKNKIIITPTTFSKSDNANKVNMPKFPNNVKVIEIEN